MGERVFNIFMYFEGKHVTEYGIRHHQSVGTDDDKHKFLQAQVSEDFIVAKRFRLVRPFTPEEWRAAFRGGEVLQYFDEGLNFYRAPREIVYCITSIVDGKPVIEQVIGPGPFRGEEVTRLSGRGVMPDYLERYSSGNTFDFPRLIHDDYFIAIRTLFNARLFVSCAKLLMSAMDTLAFVEYGDTPQNFAKWLDRFVKLPPVGITSEELWEFRNSLMHMTNLASRAVSAGKVSPISIFVGAVESMPASVPGLPRPFHLFSLMTAFAEGIGRWAESYNAEPERFLKFIERYDTTISDSRIAFLASNV